MDNKNIFLIGMMAAGKTTIGKLLAEKLNLIFFDIDSELEKIMGLTIKEFYDLYSKERFRLLESTLFDNMTKKDYFVYSTGGGIIEDNVNQNILKTRGISIFLDDYYQAFKRKINNLTLMLGCGSTYVSRIIVFG